MATIAAVANTVAATERIVFTADDARVFSQRSHIRALMRWFRDRGGGRNRRTLMLYGIGRDGPSRPSLFTRPSAGLPVHPIAGRLAYLFQTRAFGPMRTLQEGG